MFGTSSNKNDKENGQKQQAALSPNAVNSLVVGTEVRGDVKSASDIRIDGAIYGTLNCEAKVIIGPTGFMQGDIICRNAVIEGRIEGNIRVFDTLNLRKSAQIQGDISSAKLVVESGAIINGNCKMGAVEAEANVRGNQQAEGKTA